MGGKSRPRVAAPTWFETNCLSCHAMGWSSWSAWWAITLNTSSNSSRGPITSVTLGLDEQIKPIVDRLADLGLSRGIVGRGHGGAAGPHAAWQRGLEPS